MPTCTLVTNIVTKSVITVMQIGYSFNASQTDIFYLNIDNTIIMNIEQLEYLRGRAIGISPRPRKEFCYSAHP